MGCVCHSAGQGALEDTPNCLQTLHHQFMGTAPWGPGHMTTLFCVPITNKAIISELTSVTYSVLAQSKRGTHACYDHPRAGKQRHRTVKLLREGDITAKRR